jgi:hypothetical protein
VKTACPNDRQEFPHPLAALENAPSLVRKYTIIIVKTVVFVNANIPSIPIDKNYGSLTFAMRPPKCQFGIDYSVNNDTQCRVEAV